jgi:hypothetical protein
LSELGKLLSDINTAAVSGRFHSEAELRQFFLSGLAESLGGKTRAQLQIRLEESLAQGRSDARVAFVVFEFKDPGRLSSPAQRRASLRETIDNLAKTAQKLGVDPDRLRGLLTDGDSAQVVSWHEPSGEYLATDVRGHPLDEPLSFRPILETASWLEGSIQALTTRELSPSNLLEDFGPGSDLGRSLFKALWDHFQETIQSERTKSFFRQWEILFSASTSKVATGDDILERIRSYGIEAAAVRSEEEVRQFLFVLHTYYAVLLKLIALLVADTVHLLGPISLVARVRKNPATEWKSAEEQLPKLAANLIEKDVFSWFKTETNSPVSAALGAVAERIEHYDAGSVRRDVLKRVYQQLIPPKLRKALGEFYTPDWAAEITLDAAGYQGHGRLIDPSCGSGTFLVLANNRLIEANPKRESSELLDLVLESVVGLDLNPVAVSTARINYLLSIVELIRTAKLSKGIRIPVYLANSVVVPAESRLNPEAPVAEVPIWDRTLVVPFDSKSPRTTNELLAQLEEFASRDVAHYLSAIRNTIGVGFEENYRPILRELHRFVSDLQSRDANGIWARFVENFFAPLFIGKFDFVVGNPPWVAPIHMPKAYRDHVNELMESSGYQEVYKPKLRTATARFAGGEPAFVACLPFIPVAFERYLKQTDEARVAFLLTSSLARSLNAGGWRESVISDRLESVVDLTPITDIHEGANSWAFVPVLKNPPVRMEIEYDFVQRSGAKVRKATSEDRPNLVHNAWSLDRGAVSFSTSDKKSPWLTAPKEVGAIFRRMIDGQPRVGDVYSMNTGIKTDDNKVYYLKSVDRLVGHHAWVTTLGSEQILIESALLYPVVLGKNLGAWTTEYSWMILPHRREDWKPYPEAHFQREFPEAFAYFDRHKSTLIRRQDYLNQGSKLPFYTVFRLSENKMGRDHVACPLIETSLKASLVPESTKLDPVSSPRPIIVDQSARTVDVDPHRAALYVAGLLNSTPYRALACVLADPKGGVPFRQYPQWTVAVLPLIPWQTGGSHANAIAELARSRVQGNGSEDKSFQAELDGLVGDLFGLTSLEGDRLTKFLDFMMGNITKWAT